MIHCVRSTVALFVLTIILSAAADAERPDVLLIMVDDLRPMLGCYDDPRIQTPNIDRLAARGVVFENAYCQYAKCCTSRLSMMTGLRPTAIGVFSNNVKDVQRFRNAHPDVHSMARCLKDDGYHTQCFGKIYHDGCDDPNDWSADAAPGRPREMWEIVDNNDLSAPTIIAERLACPVMQSPDVSDEHLFAGRMTNEVLDVINDREHKGPTFLAIGFRRPHLPFVAPKRYFDLYGPDNSWLTTAPNPPPRAPVMAWFNSDGYVGSAKRIGLTMPTRPDRSAAIAWNGYEMRSYLGVPPSGPIDQTLQLKLIHAYAACVSYVDAQIGRILDTLDQSRKSDNTYVILCSDHGWHLGEHSAWGKMTNYEIATRVPLIVSGPEVNSNRTEVIAELVDIYPTICDLTGVGRPAHLQGESLEPTLRGRDSETGHAISQYSRFRGQFMGTTVRTHRYRFVRWVDTNSKQPIFRELYDHMVDPLELNNLADDPALATKIDALESKLIDLTNQSNRGVQ